MKMLCFSWRETACTTLEWMLALQSGVLKSSAYRTTKLSELQHIKLKAHNKSSL
jgi:hypothetical protein